RQRGQSLLLPLRPSKFDCDISAFDKSRFVKTFTECSQAACEGARRLGAEISDHRHGPLLRACGERPCGGDAAEKRDELAQLHSCWPGKAARWYRKVSTSDGAVRAKRLTAAQCPGGAKARTSKIRRPRGLPPTTRAHPGARCRG